MIDEMVPVADAEPTTPLEQLTVMLVTPVAPPDSTSWV